MSTFGKITDKTTEAELTAELAKVEQKVAEGFNPNPFACRLPLGDSTGVITAKEWRSWEKNGNQGLILSITASFDTPNGKQIDKVNANSLEEWKSFAIGKTITVTVENKSTKAEKFAKIKQTSVDVSSEKSEEERKKEELMKQLAALNS